MPNPPLRLWLLSCAVFCSAAYAAEDGAWEELARAAQAAQQQNFSGQFVRQSSSDMTSFTVYRLRGGGKLAEWRIADDGTPRETLKTRDSIHFYTASERALAQAKFENINVFPAVLPADIKVLKGSYRPVAGGEGRIAGTPCSWISLEPVSPNRYTQKFCLEKTTHLPLAQIYLDQAGLRTEVNYFTRISLQRPDIAVQPDESLHVRESLKLPPQPSRRHAGKEIRDRFIDRLPEHFFILSDTDTSAPRNPELPARHYVISDGLVQISLFIENAQDGLRPERYKTIRGALSIAQRHSGTLVLTAVGDMPPADLSRLLAQISIHPQP